MSQLGKYTLHEKLGEGGFATVYRATHLTLGSEAAVKVLNLTDTESSARQRFIREAQVAAGFDHPQIVRILGLGEEQDQVYIAMAYFPEGDLGRWLKTRGKLTRREILTILADTASALDYAHARQAWHRDVKPGNILMDPAGRAHLADFGLVAVPDAPHLTQIGGVVGSPAYMAPEQAEGRELSGAADQYSLAVVAYELITGRLPFTADSSTSVALMHLTQTPPLPSQVNPEVPAEVDAVLMRALAKKPAERYPSCSELVRELDNAFQQAEAGRFRALLNEAREHLKAGQPEQAHSLLGELTRLVPTAPQNSALLQSLEAEIGQSRQYAALVKNWDLAHQQAVEALELAPKLPDPAGIFPVLGLRPKPRPPLKTVLREVGIGLLVGLIPALGLLILFWLWIDKV